MPNAWDQQEGEPDATYNRFLVYLGMGPSRSLTKAYAVHQGKPASEARRNAPGCWLRLSKRWRWVERVRAYDRAVMLEANRHTMAKLLHGIDTIALKSIREIERTNPNGWKQAVEGLALVAELIPTESAATAALACDDGKPPENLIPPD
ncbi:MAG: hypothetical protein M1132_13535 [Chloroflexi bacterium]|nr:hypothetical protein [Chloroflexota bacterium]